jgi:hypothetical protein
MFKTMPRDAAAAWTNFIELDESPVTAAEKLLRQLGDGAIKWSLGSVKLERAVARNPAAAIAAHKRSIALELGPAFSAHRIPFFRSERDWQQYYFLQPSRSGAQAGLALEGDPEILIRLCLIGALLSQTEFGAQELRAETVGPYVYVGARQFKTRHVGVGIEAFELDLKFRHKQIQTLLVAKSMKALPGAITSGTVRAGADGRRDFSLSLAPPDQLQRWDGRKSRLPDISFKSADIRASRWYLLNRLTETFTSILGDAKVEHHRSTFQPTHGTSEPYFALSEIAEVPSPLVIVNNTPHALSAAEKAVLLSGLQADGVSFSAVDFHKGGEPAGGGWVESVCDSRAWLVLNMAQGDDAAATSVIVDGMPLRRPWEAYNALAHDIVGREDVDPYTWAKFARLYRSRALYPVMQGIDVEEGPKRLSNAEHALRRCAVELALKHHFANGHIPIGDGAPEGLFTVIHTNRVFLSVGAQSGTRLSYLSAARIKVANGALTILDAKFYPEIDVALLDRLSEEFPCLGGRIVGDSLYVVDESSKRFLRRYTGAIVPKIILNTRYQGIEQAIDAISRAGALSPAGIYSRSSEHSLLPYYTPPMPKEPRAQNWRGTAFIEDRGAFVRYFVPSLQAANASMGFSNMHDLMVYDIAAPGLAPPVPFASIDSGLLEEPLIQLYLSTLTCGVLRLNDNSKASLLEKIARLAGMDT